MKITNVKTYHMRGVQRNWTFVKIETDQRLYGWGEGTLEGLEHTVEQAIHALANRYLLENQLADIIQPDVSHCFGISELHRIAAAAETYYIRLAPHNPNGPISTAAAVQVCAAIPNFAILETIDSPPWHQKVQKEPLKFANGYIELPTAPGLGVDLDEEVIRARPYTPRQDISSSYADGSPVESVIGNRPPREDAK